jgi:hypothetical protein
MKMSRDPGVDVVISVTRHPPGLLHTYPSSSIKHDGCFADQRINHQVCKEKEIYVRVLGGLTYVMEICCERLAIASCNHSL